MENPEPTPHDFETKVIESLARLETHMEGLVGNGQPGRVTKLEEKVDGLSKWRWMLIGGAIALSAIIHFVFRY